MPSYANTIIKSKISKEVENSIIRLIESDNYYVPDYNINDGFFRWPEINEDEFFKELTSIHPGVEIEIESSYESYHYIGIFNRIYKGGEFLEGNVWINYDFYWPIETNQLVKDYIEENLINYYDDDTVVNKVVDIDGNECEDIIHEVVLTRKKYREITQEKINYPLKFKAIKQGTTVFISIGFDMKNLHKEAYDLFKAEQIKEDTSQYPKVDTFLYEDMTPVDDSDIPF